MHKIIITIIFLLMSNTVNAMTTNEYVNALEQKLFGTTYPNLSIDKRVDKIEMQIYDNSYSGTPEERLSKIDKIYPKSEFETGRITQQQTNYAQDYDNYEPDYPDYQDNEKSNYNNYPIVSKIEENIYKKNYSGEDIYKRLARLEQELYGNIKSEESLQERVERLRSVLPATKHSDKIATKAYEYTDFSINQSNDYNYNNSELEQLLSEIELETFNRSFNRDNTSKRLERLENFYYGHTSIGQSEDERIAKLYSMIISSKGMKDYFSANNSAKWAGILMNLLMIGLGFLL